MAVQLRLNGTLSPNDVIAKKLSDLPTLVGSYSAREGDLPDGFKTLAGLELLPKPLIALYIQPPKNGALYTLNQAIRSYAGLDLKGNSDGNLKAWDKSDAKTDLLRKLKKETLSATHKSFYEGKNSASRPKANAMQLLQGIVQHFERINLLTFAELKANLRPTQVCGQAGTEKEKLAELLLQIFTFYGLLTSHGRASAVVAILNSANSNDIANYSFNPDTKYVIDPDDTAHDVSKVLNEAGKACGLLDDELDAVLEMIGDGRGRATDGEKRKKVEDPRTTKLFEQMWLLLAEQGRATDRLRDFKEDVERVIQAENGALLKKQLKSGHCRDFDAAEIQAGHQYIIRVARDTANGRGFTNKAHKYRMSGLVNAINTVSRYERTREQARSFVGSRRIPLAYSLIQNGYSPELVSSEDYLVKSGFVKDEEALAGWSHPGLDSEVDIQFLDVCQAAPIVATPAFQVTSPLDAADQSHGTASTARHVTKRPSESQEEVGSSQKRFKLSFPLIYRLEVKFHAASSRSSSIVDNTTETVDSLMPEEESLEDIEDQEYIERD